MEKTNGKSLIMAKTMDKQELQHILGGTIGGPKLEENNCNGIGTCQTCKNGCQSQCITGLSGSGGCGVLSTE